jgi:hypothetical protein
VLLNCCLPKFTPWHIIEPAQRRFCSTAVWTSLHDRLRACNQLCTNGNCLACALGRSPRCVGMASSAPAPHVAAYRQQQQHLQCSSALGKRQHRVLPLPSQPQLRQAAQQQQRQPEQGPQQVTARRRSSAHPPADEHVPSAPAHPQRFTEEPWQRQGSAASIEDLFENLEQVDHTPMAAASYPPSATHGSTAGSAQAVGDVAASLDAAEQRSGAHGPATDCADVDSGDGSGMPATELIFRFERRGDGWGEEIFPHLTVENRLLEKRQRIRARSTQPDPWEVCPSTAM